MNNHAKNASWHTWVVFAASPPLIYEINTWVWLSGLTAAAGVPITLANVPAAEWDSIAAWGLDHVWLMGVWERSPAGVDIANKNAGLVQDFCRTLADFRPADNVGSGYCVRNYAVDPHLGGREGLAIARHELARRGVGLLLDFVPNHIAPDSPWIAQHPNHFMQGRQDELESHPGSFIRIGEGVFACGRDPYFPPWPDVVQVNAFAPGVRQAVGETLLGIAAQCDGVRCDMAMLLINRIFAQTWGERAGAAPVTEYWPELIDTIKEQHPRFLFIAEAYWNLERELQQQGFDLCYDKTLYDRLQEGDAAGVRQHLGADLSYQEKLIRFVENHDEPRAAASFSPERAMANAIILATVPGAKLFYEGQFEGRRVRMPTFLGRRPLEPVNQQCQAFYRRLLAAIHDPALRQGRWALCTALGLPENPNGKNLAAWSWALGPARRLVVVNLSDLALAARVQLPWNDLAGKQWRLADALSEVEYTRDGSEIENHGLSVELAPWGAQILVLGPLA